MHAVGHREPRRRPRRPSAAPTGVGRTTSSTYGTIADLHTAIVDGGFECTLEYPGLKDDVTANEVSICTIEDEPRYLTIWGDPADLTDFASSSDGSTGTVALGANWSISVTSADLAGRLAEALGGTARQRVGARQHHSYPDRAGRRRTRSGGAGAGRGQDSPGKTSAPRQSPVCQLGASVALNA